MSTEAPSAASPQADPHCIIYDVSDSSELNLPRSVSFVVRHPLKIPGVVIRDFAYRPSERMFRGESEPTPSRKVGAWKVRGLYDFVGSNETELSFTEGQILNVTEFFDNGWLSASNDQGQRGFIPTSFTEWIE
ncbi:hypothetical protein H696_04496 [Fonticula alba]|uniref:SH3 domain-containing protein n=1 Tax=Fonticula alba TaxID=691883 RepID=A0A058Z4N5_FONAL|nr:hypothetical protein H696_04496 [Fonticula alba]KCV69081.1 hypothetical protein H696_04496 [Fonticula alba]|eukprot:XP_009496652.1 hypothetical protein H696_04496 [Fonticula alba]